MSNFMYFTVIGALGGTVAVPTARRNFAVDHFLSFSKQAYADDPQGTTTVTFSGANAGSEIRVYLPDTTEVAGIETCAANQVLTWPVYAPGSANNTVRIVIIHPDYKIKEFNYTSVVGNQSLPVQQERDKWYSNPA